MGTLLRDSSQLAARAGAPSSTAGAIVVGGDYQGLGIVRSLGRHGIPVCVIDDEPSISRFSRYCTHYIPVQTLREEQQIIKSLAALAEDERFRGWVLYPTREELVAALSRNRALLSQSFRVPTPEWSSIQWAWDKRNTYRLGRELGIPTPATYYPETVDQLAELDRLTPPFVIKPAVKEHFVYATKAKAWRANNHAELRTLFMRASELVGPGEVMVQELIPGGGMQQYSYCAFFREGKSAGKMVARRLRQHPLEFGRSSTYVETVDIPVLEELSERFLRASGYYGLVELEYKLDPRDHEYKLLDVNARTWGYHSLGPRAGVDFSYMLYADQVGLPVPQSTAQAGVAWVRMTTDVPAALVGILKGQTGIGSYLSSLRNCHTEAVFCDDDPVPALMEVLMIPYLAVKRGF